MKGRNLSNRASTCGLLPVAVLILLLFISMVTFQADTTVAQGTDLIRDLPNGPVQMEQIFDVTVTFTAPADNFNAIGLVDNVPPGWTIQVDTTWCTPNPDHAKIEGDQAQYAWFGPFSAGQSFTSRYKITVPSDVDMGAYTFDGQLGYNIASGDRVFKGIGGDSSIVVTVTTPASTPTPIPTATPASTQTLTPTPTDTPTPAPSAGLGVGAWIGIGIGALLVILLLAGLVKWLGRRRRTK